MRVVAAVWTLALPACLSGCADPPVSLRPLYTESDQAHEDPRIEGEWISPSMKLETGEETQLRWRIAEPFGGKYKVGLCSVQSDLDRDGCQWTYELALVSLGDGLFFDAQPYPSNKEKDSLSPGLVALHLVGPIWVEQDFVRMALLEPRWVDENLPENVREAWNGQEIITSSTEELRNLVVRAASNPKALFEWYLCRPGTDCEARAIDDMLEREPDDVDTLGGAVKFFLQRGNYGRAIALQRRLVELDPKEATRHEQLGKALLVLLRLPVNS